MATVMTMTTVSEGITPFVVEGIYDMSQKKYMLFPSCTESQNRVTEPVAEPVHAFTTSYLWETPVGLHRGEHQKCPLQALGNMRK